MTDKAPAAPVIDLEFDTGMKGGAQLGDIASSLVSIDELLRDLASLTSSNVEFRKIEIVAIEMRHPLKIRLSLFGIPHDAIKAFQEFCRDIIRFPERTGHGPLAAIGETRLTEIEAERIRGLITALRNAKVPLKRVEVKER